MSKIGFSRSVDFERTLEFAIRRIEAFVELLLLLDDDELDEELDDNERFLRLCLKIEIYC